MADGFSVDPDVLSAVAPRFSAEAQRLATALETLQSRLDSSGQPWGDDRAGKAFGAEYEPHRSEFEQALAVLALGLASIDAALTAMAGNHADADRASTIASRDGGSPSE